MRCQILFRQNVERSSLCRFQTTFLGSRAIVGDLVGSGFLEAEDTDGVTVRQSLGVSKDQDTILSDLAYKPAHVKGYIPASFL